MAKFVMAEHFTSFTANYCLKIKHGKNSKKTTRRMTICYLDYICIKACKIRTANIAPVLSPLLNTPAILINDILIPILDASSKHIYWSFLAKKQTTAPTSKEKLSAKYHLGSY